MVLSVLQLFGSLLLLIVLNINCYIKNNYRCPSGSFKQTVTYSNHLKDGNSKRYKRDFPNFTRASTYQIAIFEKFLHENYFKFCNFVIGKIIAFDCRLKTKNTILTKRQLYHFEFPPFI